MAFSFQRQDARQSIPHAGIRLRDSLACVHVFDVGHFKKLKAWQHAQTLAVVSKPLIDRLPASERSGLADQWRRAASSVALNIAEGASRFGNKEFRKHLGIARASLDEIEAIIELAVGLDYLKRVDVGRVVAVRDECARTVYGLIRKLQP